MKLIYNKQNIMTNVITLFNTFKQFGFDLFIVGGAVRDELLGKDPKDIDLSTNATPDEICSLLNSIGWKVLEIGEAFGIIFTISPDGEEFEIATFRTDGSGRKPTVTIGASIEEDVRRRDFTINALFKKISGEIVDLVGGTNDLKNRIIRTVGDPDLRFSDDPLRKLRAIRFASNLGFEIEKETLESIINDPSLNGVSKERIFSKTGELIKCKNFNSLQELLILTGLDKVIFGESLTPFTFKVKEFEMFLALNLLRKSSKFINRLEVECCIPSDIANRVRLILLLLSDVLPNIRKISKLIKEDEDFFNELSKSFPKEGIIQKFINFKPSVSAEELMIKGIKGKDLGITLQNTDILNF